MNRLLKSSSSSTNESRARKDLATDRVKRNLFSKTGPSLKSRLSPQEKEKKELEKRIETILEEKHSDLTSARAVMSKSAADLLADKKKPKTKFKKLKRLAIILGQHVMKKKSKEMISIVNVEKQKLIRAEEKRVQRAEMEIFSVNIAHSIRYPERIQDRGTQIEEQVSMAGPSLVRMGAADGYEGMKKLRKRLVSRMVNTAQQDQSTIV